MDKKQKQAKKRKAAQKRRAKIAHVVQTMAEKLTSKLKELAEGKTYPQKLKAHVAFYHTCNEAEKIFLRKLFWREEEKDLNEAVA